MVTSVDEAIYERIKRSQTLIDDAPHPDDELIKIHLKRLGVALPVPIQFQYNAGEDIDDRWKNFRVETVAIPAQNHIPFWYPWIYKIDVPTGVWRTVYSKGTDAEELMDYWRYQAVIRWRVWKQGKADGEGFLEIALVSNPSKRSSWRERFSIHTFDPRLNIKPLYDLLDAARGKNHAGRLSAFESPEIMLYRLERAYHFLLKVKPRPSQIEIAEKIGISRSALNKNLKVSTKGSHRQFKHPTKKGRVTVPGKLGDNLAPGTLNSIYKQAQIQRR